ncbi:MAG TPA: hypothetical protein VN376_05505 [Longilinea sp.]|nr:hypothetical protein [Longilinea sp.]
MTDRRTQRPSSRAEQSRLRREKALDERQQQAAQTVQRPVQSAPVMVRQKSVAGANPAMRKSTTHPRKQIYYNLGAPGAEMRLPALPAMRMGWRSVSGIAVALITALIIFIATSPALQVNAVAVNGLTRLTAEEVQAVLNLDGTPVFAIDRKEVIRTLSGNFPELIQPRVEIGLSNQITVTATERTPVIAWVTSEQTTWLDVEGVLFDARGDLVPPLTVQSTVNPPLDLAMLPYGAGNDGLMGALLQHLTAEEGMPPHIQSDVLIALAVLNQRMPSLTTYVYDPVEGLGWTDPAGWTVYMGVDLNDMDRKMQIYQAIVDELTRRGIQPVMISVVHPDAPYYRTEP